MNPPLPQLAASLTAWCFTEPLIVRAFIYGSRVRGTDRLDSDLDVAVELKPLPGDSSELATWMGEARRLKTQLGSVLPVALDLEWHGGPVETPTVHRGLRDGCILVFDREPCLSESEAPKR